MKFKIIQKWKTSFFQKISLILLLFGLTLFTFADRFSYLELFAQTLNLIKINYFQPIDTKTLIYGAIKGLLRKIDPHSHFLLPKDLKNLEKETKGQFYSLGIEVEQKENFITIISVIQHSPAQKAGLQHGDRIFKIDNQIVKNFTTNEFLYFFKNKSQKIYKIIVLRKNQIKPLTFRVRSAHLKIHSVNLKVLEKGLLYLRIYYFSEQTLFETNSVLKNKKIKGMILDLRGNPGGVFEQSVKIADLFLNEGLIVRYKIKTEKKAKEFIAHYSDTLPDFPLVVLIDEYSASGSEIVAGALKDHKRATLVGRKTFGKGSIQNVFHLAGNHALKLTVGEYQTPSGKFIHKKGIPPLVKIDKNSTIPEIKNISSKSVLKDAEVYQAFLILKKKIRK